MTDNEPEFRASEFENVLHEFNIEHVFSTPYMPSSNGCVERVNSTVIELPKGMSSNTNEWDKGVSALVMNYNSTVHSQLKMSPSQCILSRPHDINQPIPNDNRIVETWKEGHPNFCPFKVSQKVTKKIVKVGNKLEYKLGQKFEGPYSVTKVCSNGLTYEITKPDAVTNKCIKAHYKQLRLWRELPHTISR